MWKNGVFLPCVWFPAGDGFPGTPNVNVMHEWPDVLHKTLRRTTVRKGVAAVGRPGALCRRLNIGGWWKMS